MYLRYGKDSAKLREGCTRVCVVLILAMGKVSFRIVLVCSLRCEAETSKNYQS